MRPVFDLSLLNNFIESKHFQMENLSSIKTLLNLGDWMTNVDLWDAYLTVAIDPHFQKFRTLAQLLGVLESHQAVVGRASLHFR